MSIPTASVSTQVALLPVPRSSGKKAVWVTPMTIATKPRIDPTDRSMWRVTIISTMPVDIMATEEV